MLDSGLIAIPSRDFIYKPRLLPAQEKKRTLVKISSACWIIGQSTQKYIDFWKYLKFQKDKINIWIWIWWKILSPSDCAEGLPVRSPFKITDSPWKLEPNIILYKMNPNNNWCHIARMMMKQQLQTCQSVLKVITTCISKMKILKRRIILIEIKQR